MSETSSSSSQMTTSPETTFSDSDIQRVANLFDQINVVLSDFNKQMVSFATQLEAELASFKRRKTDG